MTTKASARQAMPPSRNASGVDPPATAATPVTLSSIAMPGAITDTEIAMASHRRSEPCASSPLSAPGIRSGLVLAMGELPSFRHQDGVVVQHVVEGKRLAVELADELEELEVHRMGSVGGHGVEVGKLGVEEVGVAAVTVLRDVLAEAHLGGQADLLRPGRDHGAQLRVLLRGQLTGELEQHDVLQAHRVFPLFRSNWRGRARRQ